MKDSRRSHAFLKDNLSFTEREIRLVVGAILVVATMSFTPTPIGWWGVMALLAVPLVVTALIGWDPVYALFHLTSDRLRRGEVMQSSWTSSNVGTLDRAVRIALGVFLIGNTVFHSVPGWEVELALLAIPVIMTAIMAWDPIYAVLNFNSFASAKDAIVTNPELKQETLAQLYVFKRRDKVTDDTDFDKAA